MTDQNTLFITLFLKNTLSKKSLLPLYVTSEIPAKMSKTFSSKSINLSAPVNIAKFIGVHIALRTDITKLNIGSAISIRNFSIRGIIVLIAVFSNSLNLVSTDSMTGSITASITGPNTLSNIKVIIFSARSVTKSATSFNASTILFHTFFIQLPILQKKQR